MSDLHKVTWPWSVSVSCLGVCYEQGREVVAGFASTAPGPGFAAGVSSAPSAAPGRWLSLKLIPSPGEWEQGH